MFDALGAVSAAETLRSLPASPMMSWELAFSDPELYSELQSEESRRRESDGPQTASSAEEAAE